MRIAVVSDIHSNLAAFDAVLHAAGEFDQLWCLGDSVGYGPQPNEVVARLAELNHLAVAGNHEHAALGLIDLDTFNPLAREAAEWTAGQLTDLTRDFLSALPTIQTAEGFTLVHGSPRQHIWEYVLSTDIAGENFDHFDGPYCLVGHTHVPTVFALHPDGEVHGRRIVGDAELSLTRPGWRFILNPGSVGQPRDEDPRSSYLMIDTERGIAQWRRVAYEIADTQERMRSFGLPAQLIERLTAGW